MPSVDRAENITMDLPEKVPPQIETLWGGRVTEAEAESAIASHMLYNIAKKCASCGTSETPLWRKGWHDNVLGHHNSLCNACGLKYAKKQYCPYCMYVYKINVDVHSHRKDWIACTGCTRWVHAHCENTYGNSNGNTLSYRCPDCQVSGKTSPTDASLATSETCQVLTPKKFPGKRPLPPVIKPVSSQLLFGKIPSCRYESLDSGENDYEMMDC